MSKKAVSKKHGTKTRNICSKKKGTIMRIPTVSETNADDAIHPFVCPVSEEVFCTVSPEVFQLLMNRALAKIIHMKNIVPEKRNMSVLLR